MKQDLTHGHGIGFSLFGGQGVASGDKQAILDFNSALQKGIHPAKAWATTMSNASISAQNMTRDALRSKGSLVELANGLQATGVKAKFASVGMKALSIAGNMLMMMGISFAIQGLIDLGNAEEKAIQQAEELAQKTSETFEETKSELKELDDLIKEYNDLQVSGKWDNTPIETKKQIQEDINKLLEDEAEYVDLIKGKYNETTQELYKKKQLKREELEQDAYDAKEAAKGSLEWKGTNDQQRNLGRIDMFVPDEMTDEEKAVLEEYKHLFDINAAQNVDGVNIPEQYILKFDSVEDMLEKYAELEEMYKKLYGEDGYNLEGSDLYNRIGTIINAHKDKVSDYRKKNSEYEDAAVGNILGDILNDPNNGFGGYVETLEEYQKVVEFINNSNYDNKESILKVLAGDFPEFSSKVDTATGDVNKMTVSLEHLKNASSGISHLSKAIKEFNDDGYITTGTLSSIKEAVGSSVSNWDEYEKKLLNAKAGSAEFNQIMSDLTYAILENTFAEAGLENATEEQIEAVLRENDVANADALAIEYLARAKAQAKIAGTDFSNITKQSIEQLVNEGINAGLTEAQMYNLIISHIQFNNTNLDPTQKIEALKQIMIAAGLTAEAVNGIFDVGGNATTSKSSWDDKQTWMTRNGVTAVEDAKGRTGKTKDGKTYNYKDYMYNGVRYDTVDDVNAAIARDKIKSEKSNQQFDFSTPQFLKTSAKELEKKGKEYAKKVTEIQEDLAEKEKNFAESMADAWEKEHLERLKDGLKKQKDIIDKYKKNVEVLDFGLNSVEADDFASRSDLLSDKLDNLKSYGAKMRAEFDRVAYYDDYYV